MGLKHFFLRDPKTGRFERITDEVVSERALNEGDQASYFWIYIKDPSTQAFTDLVNRTLGKPVEAVDLPEGALERLAAPGRTWMQRKCNERWRNATACDRNRRPFSDF